MSIHLTYRMQTIRTKIKRMNPLLNQSTFITKYHRIPESNHSL